MNLIKTVLRSLWSSKRPGWRLLRLLLAFVLLSGVTLMLMENHLIYFPSRYPVGEWDTRPFSSAGCIATVIEDLNFQAADGTRLHGWLCRPHEQPKLKELVPIRTDWLILCCHGNAGNLSDRKAKLSQFNQLPANVFIFDYRGYGKSEGSPDEDGLYADTQAAWELMLAQGFKPERIIIHGTSLGGGPAIELATRVQPAALVVEDTFTSVPDMAAVAYPFVPRFLVRTKFDNLAKIRTITCPKLIVHGTEDEVIPFRMGEELFAAAAEPKTFYAVAGGSHNDTFLTGDQYLNRLRQLMGLTTPAE